MHSATLIHIIYTETEVLLSRQSFASWRDIQNAYASYMTSIGPRTIDELVDYLEQEHSHLLPSAKAQVESFLLGDCESYTLTFDERFME
jgi:hypothetical protein